MDVVGASHVQYFLRVRTLAEEVRISSPSKTTQNIKNIFAVNFPVVTGGYALIASTALALGGGAGGAGIVPLVAAGALGVLGNQKLCYITP